MYSNFICIYANVVYYIKELYRNILFQSMPPMNAIKFVPEDDVANSDYKLFCCRIAAFHAQ